MKTSHLLLFSTIALAACGGTTPAPSDPIDAGDEVDAEAALPAITVTATPDTVAAGGSLSLAVEIENFEIVNPTTTPGAEPGKGHFHYQLDTEDNYTAAWATPVYVTIDAATPPGEHTLRVWLVNGNHVEITPPTDTTITITVE